VQVHIRYLPAPPIPPLPVGPVATPWAALVVVPALAKVNPKDWSESRLDHVRSLVTFAWVLCRYLGITICMCHFYSPEYSILGGLRYKAK
jgi:hypothetical protein